MMLEPDGNPCQTQMINEYLHAGFYENVEALNVPIYTAYWFSVAFYGRRNLLKKKSLFFPAVVCSTFILM